MLLSKIYLSISIHNLPSIFADSVSTNSAQYKWKIFAKSASIPYITLFSYISLIIQNRDYLHIICALLAVLSGDNLKCIGEF